MAPPDTSTQPQTRPGASVPEISVPSAAWPTDPLVALVKEKVTQLFAQQPLKGDAERYAGTIQKAQTRALARLSFPPQLNKLLTTDGQWKADIHIAFDRATGSMDIQIKPLKKQPKEPAAITAAPNSQSPAAGQRPADAGEQRRDEFLNQFLADAETRLIMEKVRKEDRPLILEAARQDLITKATPLGLDNIALSDVSIGFDPTTKKLVVDVKPSITLSPLTEGQKTVLAEPAPGKGDEERLGQILNEFAEKAAKQLTISGIRDEKVRQPVLTEALKAFAKNVAAEGIANVDMSNVTIGFNVADQKLVFNLNAEALFFGPAASPRPKPKYGLREIPQEPPVARTLTTKEQLIAKRFIGEVLAEIPNPNQLNLIVSVARPFVQEAEARLVPMVEAVIREKGTKALYDDDNNRVLGIKATRTDMNPKNMTIELVARDVVRTVSMAMMKTADASIPGGLKEDKDLTKQEVAARRQYQSDLMLILTEHKGKPETDTKFRIDMDALKTTDYLGQFDENGKQKISVQDRAAIMWRNRDLAALLHDRGVDPKYVDKGDIDKAVASIPPLGDYKKRVDENGNRIAVDNDGKPVPDTRTDAQLREDLIDAQKRHQIDPVRTPTPPQEPTPPSWLDRMKNKAEHTMSSGTETEKAFRQGAVFLGGIFSLSSLVSIFTPAKEGEEKSRVGALIALAAGVGVAGAAMFLKFGTKGAGGSRGI